MKQSKQFFADRKEKALVLKEKGLDAEAICERLSISTKKLAQYLREAQQRRQEASQ